MITTSLRLQQPHQPYCRVRKTRATARNQIQGPRHLELPDADFGQEFSFDFPADAHARHYRDAHAHLDEALDAFDRGHFDVARERVAAFLEELGHTRARNGNSRPARNDRFLSPIEAPESGNKIEVPVPAYKREGMLAAERGDPKIVRGNGLAFPFQFEADG